MHFTNWVTCLECLKMYVFSVRVSKDQIVSPLHSHPCFGGMSCLGAGTICFSCNTPYSDLVKTRTVSEWGNTC